MMKKLLIIIFALISIINASAMKEKYDSLSVIKDETTLNIAFDFSKMTYGNKMAYQDFLISYTLNDSKSNITDWKSYWEGTAVPKLGQTFKSALNGTLAEGKCKIRINNDSACAYRCLVTIDKTDKNDGETYGKVSIVDTKTNQVITTIEWDGKGGDSGEIDELMSCAMKNGGKQVGKEIVKRLRPK
jgi:hypothetical protein